MEGKSIEHVSPAGAKERSTTTDLILTRQGVRFVKTRIINSQRFGGKESGQNLVHGFAWQGRVDHLVVRLLSEGLQQPPAPRQIESGKRAASLPCDETSRGREENSSTTATRAPACSPRRGVAGDEFLIGSKLFPGLSLQKLVQRSVS